MNVNLNVAMPQVTNVASTNNKISSADNKFLNLLVSSMNDNLGAQNPVDLQQNNMNEDILNILTGMNMMNFVDLDGENKLNNDVFNIKSPQEEESSKEKRMLENIIDVANFMNLGNINNLSTQMETDSKLDVFNLKNDKALELNQSMSTRSDNKLHNKELENVFSMKSESSKMNELPNIKVENKASNNYAEKLISEIEKHRNSFKNEMNMQAEVLGGSRISSQENNTIIDISDESSQIKSQVLSQVIDKIEFMVDEGVEPGTTTKQVTMELHPVSLGKVDIKMTFEDNKVTVEIKAQNEETQKLISSNSDELANILGKTSESVNIIVKSNDYKFEHQLYNYNSSEQKNEDFNQDNNGGNRRQRNPYYQKDNDNDDDTFSRLINLRTIKLNV